MKQEYIRHLSRCAHQSQGSVGAVPASWGEYVAGSNASACFQLDNKKLSRQEVRAVARTSPERAFLTVMAWGGMNRRHGRAAWASTGQDGGDDWRKIVDDLQKDRIDRRVAYSRFSKLGAKRLPGMRPAFFTKLIHFCGAWDDSRDIGYIMDQWTARSVNLISGRPIVQLYRGKFVTRKNNEKAYDEFCNYIQDIAEALSEIECRQISGTLAEERLFSVGRNRGEWRNFLIDKERILSDRSSHWSWGSGDMVKIKPEDVVPLGVEDRHQK